MVQANRRGIALVIGISGGFGGAVADALSRDGWSIRALVRNPDAARRARGPSTAVEWIAGDAMEAAAVANAAKGVALIVWGANPPGYRNWRGLALPMLANAIAAAATSGARLVFPGNVYNYGPDAWPLIAETAAQAPVTEKGRVRVEMEQLLRDAAANGTRSLVVRAGDFFGGGKSSWFSQAMVKPGRPVTSVTYPGVHDAGHCFAYLPDLAETVARLARIEQRLPPFETVHFGGHWLEQGVEIARAIGRAVGRPDLPVKSLPWAMMRMIAPFAPTIRETLEMRYLWSTAVRLDNAKLVSLIGSEPHTPLDEAVRASLVALGCVTTEPAAIAA